jgi:hypothetical protein
MNSLKNYRTPLMERRDFIKTTMFFSSRALIAAGMPICLSGCAVKEKRLDKVYENLGEKLGNDIASEIFKNITLYYEDIDARKPLFSKWGMNFNLTNAIIALSSYRSLLDHGFSEEDTIEITEELVWATLPVDMYKMIFRCIGTTPDPFASYCIMTKQLNKILFPSPGWEREYISNENCFGFNVKKCLYVDYLTSEGAPELVIALCNLDYRVADLFPEGFGFYREKCLAHGDDICDFRYVRTGCA